MDNVMKYKINEVAKLLNISDEAIRYYESKGIIDPERSETSGYRLYSGWEIHMLIRARSYRKLGFTLSETAKLLNAYKSEDLLTKISDQETDIKRQLVWYENLLELIQNEKQLLANSHNLIGKYHLGYRPDIYRLDMQNRLELHANKNLKQTIRHWTNQTPFVFTSALLEKAKLTTDYSEYSDYSCGLSVLKKYAEFLEIEESKHVKYFPACACVYTVLQTSVDSPFRPALLKPAIEFMKSNELNIAGDALSKSIVMQRKNDKYVNMHFVWIPYQ